MKFRLGYGWFQENILQTDLEGEKILARKYLVKKKFPHWKTKIFQNVWSWKKILTTFYARKKILLPEVWEKIGSCIFWETVDQCIGQHLGRLRSIYWPLCQPILGRLSTDMMATLGRYSLSVNSWPILCQRIPWSTCRSKCRSTCQSMNWSSGSLVSANCWSRGCVLADMGLVLGHYSLLVGHGTAASQLVVCRWIACDQPIIIFIENTGLPVI